MCNIRWLLMWGLPIALLTDDDMGNDGSCDELLEFLVPVFAAHWQVSYEYRGVEY